MTLNDVRPRDTFWDIYERCCFAYATGALPSIRRSIRDDVFVTIEVDNVRISDWPPIFSALEQCTSIERLTFQSTYMSTIDRARGSNRPEYLTVKSIMKKLSHSIQKHLSKTIALEQLNFIAIKFHSNDISYLARGFYSNESLRKITFKCCPLKECYVSALCKSLYKCPIEKIVYEDCKINAKSAQYVAQLIQKHGAARSDQLCKGGEEQNGSDIGGIRRVVLNINPELGDKGLKILCKALSADHWVKAIDLRSCGLTGKSGSILMEMLNKNLTILVVDIRMNNLDIVMENILIQQLMARRLPQNDTEYLWHPPIYVDSREKELSNNSPVQNQFKVQKRPYPINPQEDINPLAGLNRTGKQEQDMRRKHMEICALQCEIRNLNILLRKYKKRWAREVEGRKRLRISLQQAAANISSIAYGNMSSDQSGESSSVPSLVKRVDAMQRQLNAIIRMEEEEERETDNDRLALVVRADTKKRSKQFPSDVVFDKD
ncbi:hypothetical protein GJ496_009740 [Pomphorhynchus laevis]|nr:hypothetical protein GJ496_009551 [Pomphorhynchus laevis]KAI0989157.1 hypothetical protein GJ496_009740 [Pomphorhynchus laevis]